MKLSSFALVSVLHLGVATAHNANTRHPRSIYARQETSSTATTSSSSGSLTNSSQSSAASASVTSTSGTATSGLSTSGVSTASGTATSTSIPLATGTTVPPLESLSMGMPTKAAGTATTTFTVGATPPISGAPVLPTAFVYTVGEWPAQDAVPPTDSDEVKAWMKELDGVDIPDLDPTTDGSCASDVAFAADAANRGWWTCGGHTRDTDITACPDKLTWGVSFDDGPSPYSAYLLDYLDKQDISATFFVVGSRVIERPTILLEEYMAGHEISVHTWSHRPLTSLTNEQVVAELGWTRKAIKRVLGVTPTTMRPPFGDIDDRVRAISLAMGMVPIMWTRTPEGGVFDTNDWRVAASQVSATDSFATFQKILTNASAIDTGFIVLQHDLYEICVDLAVGYTLEAARSHSPAFNLKPIGECMNIPTTDLYLESTTNKTFPASRSSSGVDTDGDGTIDTKAGDADPVSANSEKSAGFANGPSLLMMLSLAGLSLMGRFA
ncbi:hypothetical protein BDQ17DRAFT_1239435 [Cyathus striatus]|nr:hypothetical protein BDQ17DRAFT_1239435 [Cyathus striatus]